jgi:hypothetical protein
MTDSEWSHTRNAFSQMCDNGVMHEINLWHRGSFYMHGHSSPLSVRFGTWHRDLLRYFEYRLHEIDPCAVLPIWNMEIETDAALDIFSATKLNFPHDITDTSTSPTTTYSVTFNPGSGGGLAPAGSLQTILDQTELEPMLPILQGTIHDNAHVWWNGNMGNTFNAASCLPFYALNAMVDWAINHWLTGTSAYVPPVASNKDAHLHVDPVTGAGTMYRKGVAGPIVEGDITGAIVANDWNWGIDNTQPVARATVPEDNLLPNYSSAIHTNTPWSTNAYHSADTRTPMLLSLWNSTIPGTDGSIVYPGYVYYDSVCGTTG